MVITEMIDPFKQHVRSKLFRKLFLMTCLSAAVPVLVLGAFLLLSTPVGGRDGSISLFPEFYGIVLFAIVVAGVVAYSLSRHISAPISELAQGATEIARGDFSREVKVGANDEIGRLAKLFNYMTIELRRLHNMNLNKIIAERNKTQTIIKNIGDGVIVTDLKERILVLNSVAEKWFGLKESDAGERPIKDLITDRKLLWLIREATNRDDGRLPAVEVTIKRKGEWQVRVLQARAARVLQEEGELIGIVTILRDVTREKEIDRMKTELVSMVAHELRSPLTSIAGFSELLLDSDLTHEQSEEYASIILKESNRLSDLINKFLDISRIESGKIQAKKAEIDLIDVVRTTVANNEHLAARKGIAIEVHAPEHLKKVKADYGMMEQAFVNLLSNAIKYSPENTRIDFVVKETPEQVIVEVHDQGYGIPAKALRKVFDKFYRVSEHEKIREVSGSGLGLSLVKQIVDLHEGSVEVESELGRGSVFTVIVPISSGDNRHPIREEEAEQDIVW